MNTTGFSDSFYGEALATTQHGKQTFKSHNLYQLYAYLRAARHLDGWEDAEGILLYPVTSEPFDHALTLDGYRFRIVSIDLNQSWQGIHRDLLRVIAMNRFAPETMNIEDRT